MRGRKKHNGWIMTEVVVALGLAALIFTCLIIFINTTGGLNKIQLITQQCLSAGRSELDCIAVTGEPIDAEDFQRLWPNLDVRIEEQDGAGEWEGLRLVEVTITAIKAPKEISISQSRYFTSEKER